MQNASENRSDLFYMNNTEAIHLSVADAEDIEEVHEKKIPVADVIRNLIRHPGQIITRWNWKSAMLGALLRASFYFTVYQASKESLLVTLTAMTVEFSFRFFTSGISGSLVQSFRRASPPWLATFIVTVSLPVFSHTVEFFTHYIQEEYFYTIFPAAENSARQRAFAISVLFSMISAMFNIFMMRHGVLLVGAGEEQKSIWSDFRKIPYLVFEFVIFLPITMQNYWRSGKILRAFGILAAFGLAVGGVLGFFRGKWSWAWTTALGAWAVLIVWTALVVIGREIYRRRQRSPR